jgi:hypothetical protein
MEGGCDVGDAVRHMVTLELVEVSPTWCMTDFMGDDAEYPVLKACLGFVQKQLARKMATRKWEWDSGRIRDTSAGGLHSLECNLFKIKFLHTLRM